MNRRNFLATVGATATTTTALSRLLGTTEPSRQDGAPTNSCETPGGGNDDAAGTTTATGDVTVLEDELFKGVLDNAEVRGTVKNTSGEPQSYIQVTAVFFDDQDVRLGTTMWNATDVPPGQVLSFETVMSTTPYSDVARYDVEAGTSPF